MKYFAAIFLLALFFRFYLFPSVPGGLYWDEYDTGYQAYSLLKTGRDYFGNPFPAHLQAFADYRSSLYMYLTVPLVEFFGLNPFSVRLTAAVFALISVFLVYYLAGRYLDFGNLAWLPAMSLAFAPWLLVQGRIAAESTLVVPFILLGLIGFIRFIKTGRGLWLAALGFGMVLWAYGTAKLFLPPFLLLLFLVYRKEIGIAKIKSAGFILPLIMFILICSPVVYETLFKGVGMRLSELSLFTDPTTAATVDYRRLEAALGSGQARTVGMQTGLLEKAVFNKYTLWGGNLLANYFQALSTDFLFLRGDPEIRHNLNAPVTGQLYLVEIIPFILGLLYLLKSFSTSPFSRLLLGWLLLAPLPSAITRDGGTHGPRLLFLFPVLVFFIALGLKLMAGSRRVLALHLSVYMLSVFLAGYYFYSIYRVTSAAHFNSGFSQTVSAAVARTGDYDRIILDPHNENLLMAYLFTTRFEPGLFQKSFPLPSGDVAPGISGYKFGNIFLLFPGTRDWESVRLTGRNLVIASADTLHSGFRQPLFTIKNPDSTDAFLAFTLP